MASRIQNTYKNYIDTKRKFRDIQLKILLQRFIGRIINKSELNLSSALYKWSKNARLLRCNYHSTLIQDFCHNIKDVLKIMVWKKKLKKIEKGLKILESTNLGLRYAYDKLIENNKNLVLYGLTHLLQNKINNRRREVLEKINLILSKKLYQRKENIFKIRKKVEYEENRNIRILGLLKIIFDKYCNDKMAIFKKNLYRWRDKTKEKQIEAYSRIIAKYFRNKYRISKARINWSNIAEHLSNSYYSNETRDIIGNIKKLIGLQSFINDLTGKIKLDGLNQLKRGHSWFTAIEIMKNVLVEQDKMNKLKILKKFFNKWENTVDKLYERDYKLETTFKNIFKRYLIDKAKDMNNIFISKKIGNALLAARSHIFFKKLKTLNDKKEKLIQKQGNKMRNLFGRLLVNYKLILRKKLLQWKNIIKKISQYALQKRIVEFIKNKYKISIARDYWTRLVKSLDTFSSNKSIFLLIQKLKKIIALKSFNSIIDKAFKKSALDQLIKGANKYSLVNSLKRLFIDWDKRNVIISLHQMVKRWKDNANHLKYRDNKISKAFNVVNIIALKKDASSLADAFLDKKMTVTLYIGRGNGFFGKFINKASRLSELNDYKYQKIKKLVNRLIRENDQVIINKFFQWIDISKRVKKESCKRRISKLIEYKYKTSKARKKWIDLAEKYDLLIWGIIHFCFILKKIDFPISSKITKNNSFGNMKKILTKRDLKLRNILDKYKKKEKEKYSFKIGNYKMLQNFENLSESLRIILPEIINHNFKFDLCSLGIIIYILYFNNYPYITINEFTFINQIKDLGQKISKRNGNKNFDNLIKGLLAYIPNKGLTWEKYFNYQLFEKESLNKNNQQTIDIKKNSNNYKDYYDMIKKIGNGSFSSVYKAKVKGKEEYVALKVVDKEKIKAALRNEYCKQDIEEEYNKIANFYNEIKYMKICGKNNKNSVKYYQHFERDNEFAIAMELCDGNLIDFIKFKKDLDIDDMYELLSQLNNTFKIMKENKIAHRDIKLQNILVKYENIEKTKYTFKISDYGVGKEFSSFSSRFSTKVGTINFMAPEILEGKIYNNECDLWSLGVITYKLYFKSYPYMGESEIALKNQIKKHGKKILSSSGNKNFDDLVRGLLTSIPDERLTWEQYFNHPFFKNKLFT